MTDFKDFHTIKDLKFDIKKLQAALHEVLSRKNYDDACGTKYIAGISLNQIPGDPDSAKGENVKGIYWTKPNRSGKEEIRAKKINEASYTEFVEDLKVTGDIESLASFFMMLDGPGPSFNMEEFTEWVVNQ